MLYNNYFKYTPDALMIYGNIYNKGWEAALTPSIVIYAQNFGGTGSQCVPKHIMYPDVTKHCDEDANSLYAISRIKHYADGGAMISYLNIYLCDVARKSLYTPRPIMQYCSELLACADVNFNISNWNIFRPGLMFTLPFNVQEYDSITGIFLTLGITNNGYITSYQPSLSLQGLGNAAFINTDSYHAPGDSGLTLNPGSNLF